MALETRLTAVVLAGGPRDELAAAVPGAPNKAFVPIAGITLVERTIAVLRTLPRIAKIIAVAPAAAHASAALRDAGEIRPDGATMSASLRSGLHGLPPDELVLVCASDLPVLTRAALEEFIALAQGRDADIVYACVERRTHMKLFPDVPHTWAHLRDGSYCGGGCVAMRPRALEKLDAFMGRLGAARKNPLRLAAIFGAPTLLRYAARRLSVADAERRGSRMLGVRVAAAVCEHPEIAVNVDRTSDVALAECLVAAARSSV